MLSIWKKKNENLAELAEEDNLLVPSFSKIPLRIGLTGGIGSGKSTAARYFSELGIPIIDADQIAHELTKSDTPALAQIISHFGHILLDSNNQLIRSKLRELIFSDGNARQWLEKLLHPLILKEMQQQVSNVKTPYCILSIPLLIEKKLKSIVDRILVIDTPEDKQIERTQQRDQTNINDIKAILKTQITREKRLALADDVICNEGDLAKLKHEVQKLHEYYLQLA